MSEKTEQAVSSIVSPFLDEEIAPATARDESDTRIKALAEVSPFDRVSIQTEGAESFVYPREAEPEGPAYEDDSPGDDGWPDMETEANNAFANEDSEGEDGASDRESGAEESNEWSYESSGDYSDFKAARLDEEPGSDNEYLDEETYESEEADEAEDRVDLHYETALSDELEHTAGLFLHSDAGEELTGYEYGDESEDPAAGGSVPDNDKNSPRVTVILDQPAEADDAFHFDGQGRLSYEDAWRGRR